MPKLKWWMRIVGGFYVAMGLFNTPFIIQARLPVQYPDLGVAVESAAAQALMDVWFMFGLEAMVIGAALLYFSRDPLRHAALVWTVLSLELVRGIADDLYLLARGYDPLIYSGWILIHSVIIITGVIFLRQALQSNASHGASGNAMDRAGQAWAP
ncbi:MAG: BphX family protein [Dehalococcoidia bacterium]